MNTPKTLREAIQQTIDSGKQEKSVEEMAEDIGVSPNLLYRWNADEDSTSFADLPLRRLKALIESAGSFAILDYFDRKFNRIAFQIPKLGISKLEEGEMIDDYQTSTINAVASLRKFLSLPNKKNFTTIEEALLDVMKKSARVKKYCDKKASGQFEMELN